MNRILLLAMLSLGACSSAAPTYDTDMRPDDTGPEISELFDLRWVSASEMASALSARVEKEGHAGVEVLPNPRTNKLIVSGTRSQVAMVERWLADLDVEENARRVGG